MRRLSVWLWSILLLLSLGPIWESTAQTTATIVGVVTDESGAAVPNSSVKVTNELTGLTRDSASGQDGSYLANLLPPGVYSVEVSAQGFKRFVRKGVGLAVG